MPSTPKFAKGVFDFQKNAFPKNKALFETLSQGQSPEALFITCSDSRIDTGMITQTGPGELFVCRNAGNIVPPHGRDGEGMGASIEFAVAALKVPHIVVCGHSGCGAMKAALSGEGLDALPKVRDWISFSQEAADSVRNTAADKSDDEKLALLTEQNVVLQLRHLKAHPAVAARLEQGDLALHGWIYDIKTGDVTAWDEAQEKFVPATEFYGE